MWRLLIPAELAMLVQLHTHTFFSDKTSYAYLVAKSHVFYGDVTYTNGCLGQTRPDC